MSNETRKTVDSLKTQLATERDEAMREVIKCEILRVRWNETHNTDVITSRGVVRLPDLLNPADLRD